jgi:PKD repeat protein
VYGQAPTLAPNSGGTFANRVGDAPRPTVDFRTVHATVLNRLAKGDSNVGDDVLGAHYEDLQLFGPLLPPPTTTTTTAPPPTTTTTAAPKPPTAAYTINKTTGLVGMVVTVDAAASKDADGSIVSYTWSWGDGTANGTGVKLTHKFTKRGTFTVRLTVTDNSGLTHSTSKTVRVF